MSIVGMIDITEQVRAREILQRMQADFAHAARVSMLGELTASPGQDRRLPRHLRIERGKPICSILARSIV
jgi:hypothetical protein